MLLYHYTGSEHIDGIRAEGIWQGGVPLPNGDGTWSRTERGWQWLTDDPQWTQAWATRVRVHCDRTEYRFQLVVPKAHRDKLHRWRDIAPRWGIRGDVYAEFDRQGGGGADHWWLFEGRIPPGWLRTLEQRPASIAPLPRLVLPVGA